MSVLFDEECHKELVMHLWARNCGIKIRWKSFASKLTTDKLTGRVLKKFNEVVESREWANRFYGFHRARYRQAAVNRRRPGVWTALPLSALGPPAPCVFVSDGGGIVSDAPAAPRPPPEAAVEIWHRGLHSFVTTLCTCYWLYQDGRQ